MDNEKTLGDGGRDLVAKIVSSYVKHNRIGTNDLPALISSVHQAVSGLGKPATPVESLTPAVPMRQSVRSAYVVCLECGLHTQTLRRHLRVQHSLEPAAYYGRWKLPADYPITAPGYSARRSTMAKALGFGRHRQPIKTSPQPTPISSTKRGRRRRTVTAGATPSA